MYINTYRVHKTKPFVCGEDKIGSDGRELECAKRFKTENGMYRHIALVHELD